ncbi:MAG: glycosyl hydrolase family 65 protein [Candidatus Hydrogenedentota bacterium]
MLRCFSLLLISVCVLRVFPAAAEKPPDDFTRFDVPGQEETMENLRHLFWLHYPAAGPKATIWEEWLSLSSLWPAQKHDEMAAAWRTTLENRIITEAGYVATHQHASIAHQLGWPFPFWKQGKNTWGWHFSLQHVPNGWHHTEEKDTTGWSWEGVTGDTVDDRGWKLKTTAPQVHIDTPTMAVDPFEAPFIQLRWYAEGNWKRAQPYIAWRREGQDEFPPGQRLYFAPPENSNLATVMAPVYTHPAWTGTIAQLRLGIENAPVDTPVVIHSLFTQYDTRHTSNNPNFVQGCSNYFRWTGDLNFLRDNIGRMRLALRYVMEEFRALEEKAVVAPWVGHDGEPGIHYDDDGKKHLRHGHGIGHNYWDLLPFGRKDAYATMLYYDALRRMAEIEAAIAANPAWNIPRGVLAFDPAMLRAEAKAVKAKANDIFWNEKHGRFVLGIDDQGETHDYGFTFMNLEAIYYDFATKEHAAEIMAWIAGTRTVEGDTATGADIYHWRFGPRSTTKRNVTYYGWFWSQPKSLAFGDQVQDGGAVLGFAFFDLMARIEVLGPESAAQRLAKMMAWYKEVRAEGGYRQYYETHEGNLQGGGTAGGLGLDKEFFESVLVPQVMLYGFMGVTPGADGLSIAPKLPADWPALTITDMQYQGATFDITATRDTVTITPHEGSEAPEVVAVTTDYTLQIE